MRALLLAAAIGLGATASASAQVSDRALIGTWSGTGQVATSDMARTGSFALHIDPGGSYFQVFRGPKDFVVDWGPIFVGESEYWRKTSNGLEDRGGYAVTDGGFAFTGTWSRFALTPAAGTDAAAIPRIAALMRAPSRRSLEDWTARATALAALWQVDAVLEDTAIDRPAAGGGLGPLSTLSLRFRSATTDRRLVLRPMPAGGFEGALLQP